MGIGRLVVVRLNLGVAGGGLDDKERVADIDEEVTGLLEVGVSEEGMESAVEEST